jgi:hypothetical protein
MSGGRDGDHHARPRHLAPGDGVAQGHVDQIPAAQVAHGGKAALEGAAGVVRSLERCPGGGLAPLLVGALLLAAREVDVGVDQPR